MKSKFVTRVAAGVLTFAMVATTVAGGCLPTCAATKDTAKKIITVSTQKQLNAALKNNNVKRIIIKTKKAVKFKISSVSNSKKLTINAPKATVVNGGNFKKVLIKDAKKYTELGKANAITVSDPNTLTMIVPEGVTTKSVILAGDEGKVKLSGKGTLDSLTVNNDLELTVAKNVTVDKLKVESDASLKINGTVNEIDVEISEIEVNISGTTTTTPKLIVNGEDTTITSDVKVDVKANTDVELKLNEGAKGSTVEAAEGVTPTIDNQTGAEVKVSETASGSESADTKKDTSTSESTSGGSSSGSSSTPVQPTVINPIPASVAAITSLSELPSTLSEKKDYVLTANATVSTSVTIPTGAAVYIPKNVTLTVAENGTVTNYGSLITSTSTYSTAKTASLKSKRARLMAATVSTSEAGKVAIADENASIQSEKNGVLKFTDFTDLESQSMTGVIVTPGMELWVGSEKYIADQSAKITVTSGRAGWYLNGDNKLCLCIFGEVKVNEATEVYSYIVKGTYGAAATLTLASWDCYTGDNFVTVEPSGTLKVGTETIIGTAEEALFKVNVSSGDENDNRKCLTLWGKNAGHILVTFQNPEVISDNWVTITKNDTNDLYELTKEFTNNESKWTVASGVDKEAWSKASRVIERMGTSGGSGNWWLYLKFNNNIDLDAITSGKIKISIDGQEFSVNSNTASYENYNAEDNSEEYRVIFVSLENYPAGIGKAGSHTVSVTSYTDSNNKTYTAYSGTYEVPSES